MPDVTRLSTRRAGRTLVRYDNEAGKGEHAREELGNPYCQRLGAALLCAHVHQNPNPTSV